MRKAVTPTAFQFELFPLHSPLLRESLLVSFPPLNNMLKFRGFSRFIWDLIHGTLVLFLPPTNHQDYCLREEGSRQKERFTQGENNLLPTQLISTGGVGNLKRCWTEARRKVWSPPANAQSRSAGLLKKTQSILFGTGTQRGVATGLSQGRNLRSKIWWFTEFCNSHYVSHFAAFFIVTRTKISIAYSCSVVS